MCHNKTNRFIIIFIFVLATLVFANRAATAQQTPKLNGQAAIDFAQQQGLYAFVNKDIQTIAGVTSPEGREFFQVDKVIGANVQAYDRLGDSVAIDGDTAVIGASRATVSFEVGQGKAFVYVRSHGAWAQQGILIAADGAAGDYFGASVAIEGNTILIGAPGAHIGSANNQGAVYAFTRSNGSWSQQQKFTANEADFNDEFGVAVALSGSTALVGAVENASAGTGSAYIFTHDGNSWGQAARLTADDGEIFDFFGSAVALSGNTAVIGANGKHVDGFNWHGAVYIFTKTSNGWTQSQRLKPSDGAAHFYFGGAVAIHEDTLLIGAQWASVDGNNEQGAAYIFTHNGSNWHQQAKLTTSDGLAGSWFGNSVSLTENTAVIGARFTPVNGQLKAGAAYVFIQTNNGWQQQSQLLANDGMTDDNFGTGVAVDDDDIVVGAYLKIVNGVDEHGAAYFFHRSDVPWFPQEPLTANDGTAQDKFGNAVAIDGNTAVVGTRDASINGTMEQGAVYIYQHTQAGWLERAKLTAADGATSDWFGTSVALSGDTLLIGAPRATINDQNQQGAVYVFTRSGDQWQQTAKLTAADGMAEERFGHDVALDGDTAVIGANHANIGGDISEGAAYVFTRSGSTWSQQTKLTVGSGAAFDNFGNSVALSGETAVIGAPYAAVNGHAHQGAAYVFTRSGSTWSQPTKLFVNPGAADEQFGYDVALDGDTAVIGAHLTTIQGDSYQGAAYIYMLTNDVWQQTAQLVANDGLPEDQLAVSVDITRDTAVLGAWRADIYGHTDQGAAYTFSLRDDVWQPQAKFTAPDGTADSWFGYAVGSDNQQIIVGATFANNGVNLHQGAAYIFDNGQPFTPENNTIYLPLIVR